MGAQDEHEVVAGVATGPPPPTPGWNGPPPDEVAAAHLEPAPSGPSLPPAAPDQIAGIRWLYRYLVVGTLALAGASALRLLDDFAAGRWWMANLALAGTAVVCGVLGVIVGVGAVGEGLRYRRHVVGSPWAIVGLLLAMILTCVAGVRLVDDWHESDIGDAIDRFEIDGERRTILDEMDAARDVTSAEGDAIRTAGRVGGCYTGDPRVPGVEVRCRDLHTLEIVSASSLDAGDTPYPGAEGVRALALAGCDGSIDVALPPGVTLDVVVPSEEAWALGDTGYVCVLSSAEPREGALL